jgi:hypothetical protein
MHHKMWRTSSKLSPPKSSLRNMENAIDDEITSINSIYGDETLTKVSENPTTCTLRLPSHPSVILRLEFPPDYPDAPPSIPGTETVGDDAPKGAGKVILEAARDTLAKIHRPGEACIFDLVEDIGDVLREDGIEASGNAPQEDNEHTNEISDVGRSVPISLGPEPPWTLSTVITEKKSVFVARAAQVTSPSQAKEYLHHLLATDKKVAKATHNITAWRIRGKNDTSYQDCDDDGETAAGGRLLHLMQLMDVWDVMVVVTRWYGGIQLGPDRFRIINTTARDALVLGGFTNEGDAAGKKKSKK